MALTAESKLVTGEFGMAEFPANSLTYKRGSAIGIGTSGYAVLWTDANNEKFLGIAQENGTSATSVIVRTLPDIIKGRDKSVAGVMVAGVTAVTDNGASVYCSSDDIYSDCTLTPGNEAIGRVVKYVSAGFAWIQLLPRGYQGASAVIDGAVELTTGGLVDLNGVADALVLDADADTTISAPTDDQIDIEIKGVDHVVMKAVATADSAATTNIVEIAATTPVDTTGTNVHNALDIDLEIGNATGGTNTVRAVMIDAITDDAEVTTTAIEIGTGWENGLIVPDNVTIEVGTGNDLIIKHDGTDSFIDNATGRLVLDNAGALEIQWGAVGGLRADDSAISSFAGAADTAGKGVFIETQDGGAASADTDGVDGGALTITAGVGSDGGAHTSNDPNGGDSGNLRFVVQAGGAAGSGGSGTAGKDGHIALSGAVVRKQATPTAKTTTAGLEAAEIAVGIVTVTHAAGANQDYQLPLGTELEALFNWGAVDEGFEWSIINLSGSPGTNTATITVDTGHTIVGEAVVGNAAVGTNSGRFFTRRTASDTFVTYRIG